MRKTYTLIFVVLMMFASCDKYDDSSIRNDIQKLDERVSALEKWQGEVNRNIASLQTIVEALNGRDYVTDVSEIKDDEGYTVGYNVHFNKGGSKTITFNSKEPSIHIPVIGVKTGPDGIYYWTLDGEWMLDDTGEKIKASASDGTTPKLKIENDYWLVSYDNGKTWEKLGATASDGKDGKDGIDGKDGADGITPKFKIDDGFWFVSYDNGKTWEILGAAEHKGADGKTPVLKVENGFWFASYDDGKTWEKIGPATSPDSGSGTCIFKKVTVSDSYVTFVLADGTTFALPIGEELSISFTRLDAGVLSPGSISKIRYEVTSPSNRIDIEAISSSDLTTEIDADDSSNKTGIIKVYTGETVGSQPKVVVLVSNGSKIIMKSIHFDKGGLEINDNSSRTVDYKGGTISLEFLTNLEYDVIISSGAKAWISQLDTRSLAKHSLKFSVSENLGEDRTGTITIQSRSSSRKIVYTITQKGICSLTLPDGNGYMPCGGTLTSQYSPDDPSNGLDKMVDGNPNTSFKISGKSSFEITWEGNEVKSFKKYYLHFGYDSNTRPDRIELLGSTDGVTWNNIIGIKGSKLSLLERDFPTSAQFKFIKLRVNNSGNAETITIAEFHLIGRSNDYSTFDDVVANGSSFTNTTSTPMGNHYANKHVTTEADRKWLSTASNEPNTLPSAPSYSWREYTVNLYPFGEPMPADVNQHGVGDCSALAVLAEMAYQFPDFIKSIIKDNGDRTYSVNMFDPQGKEVIVTVKSTFLGNDGGMCAATGKKNEPTWASVLEKAIMKWNYIYKVNPDIYGIGSEHVAPLFTGNGNSFAYSPNTVSAGNLKTIVDLCLKERMIVIGGFNTGGLSVGQYRTVTAHAYSFMYSGSTTALFSMRNPWGYSPGSSDGKEDGILDIVNDGIVPPTIDLRIIYPGAAKKYAKKDLGPYLPPKW